MALYRNVVRVTVLSDEPWEDWQLHDLRRIDHETDEGHSVGKVEVEVRNEELTSGQMRAALLEAGNDGEFFEEAMEVHADLWVVHYEIREEADLLCTGEPVARGLVEVDGPDGPAADRHAKTWVAAHDGRFIRGRHHIRILRAEPART